MGYIASQEQFDALFSKLKETYEIWAPKKFIGGGRFSNTDAVRYAVVTSPDEIEFSEKSDYSWKEAVFPPSETLFYFTENHTEETEGPAKKKLVFLRSCDLAAVKRTDQIYMKNGDPDYYYARRRGDMAFVMIGCRTSCRNGFCVSMGTNQSDNYDMSVDAEDGAFRIDCKRPEWDALLKAAGAKTADVVPRHVNENNVKVQIPENLSYKVGMSSMWDQYDSRCINCGRCNFVCPTCTCFTMQDVYYDANGKVGERRRVQASCMVDGYTDVAGGGSYRQKNGQRMRFKTLHKVLDFKERFGYQMCVGCGRCDDICPEYISFSNIINHLEEGMKEVADDER
ncbi:anaerobic sulfite reductase subunit AsrA [Pseudoramibacter sp.]|jgi:anaerobic sulfite reductase subunit A|uniref:anaerobic sulfite reductase subunit AsrA n=1 Tax=Pseudoramibacter sp. TaxID=2034862 RepID=UPI0025DECEA8|nr:anaerobic sulfite reductase subunit AsrA [Pseudoramibacter sp.]MCH4071379.1 anaerobic sulfite reductase subunit AsrA [Pseudoramibacter sp.]MCH4105147.1 anaerobic sulfite reductase subunit AsrA [Pseudoramibacter sp.]